MNEHQYTNIRNYLEGIASKQAELLTEQRRTNELLATIAAQSTPTQPAPATRDAGSRATPVTIETVKEAPLKTTETVEVKELAAPKRSTKKAKA